MRGRVYSIRTLLSRGSTPVGSLGIGWICHVSGPRTGLAVGGGFALLAAVVTLRARHRANMRPAPDAAEAATAETAAGSATSEPDHEQPVLPVSTRNPRRDETDP
jgi:hypothetical protein